MGEKLVAGLVTAAVISPVCAVCVLGPAAIGSLFAGIFGWLGGFEPLPTIALMTAAGAGALVYRHFLRRRMRLEPGRGRPCALGSLTTQAGMGGSRVPRSRSGRATSRPQGPVSSR